MALRLIVAYDVVADRDRARIAAALSEWGDRIQKSVFACTLGRDEKEELVSTLQTLMDDDTDLIHIFTQCASCHDQETLLGQAESFEIPRYWVV